MMQFQVKGARGVFALTYHGTLSVAPDSDKLLKLQGCPCTVETICRGADNPGYWGQDCEWLKAAYPGMWYFEHGGRSRP